MTLCCVRWFVDNATCRLPSTKSTTNNSVRTQTQKVNQETKKLAPSPFCICNGEAVRERGNGSVIVCPQTSSSVLQLTHGSTSFVVIVSFPPVGVNLHALLDRHQHQSEFNLTQNKRGEMGLPCKVSDNLPQPRFIPDNDPSLIRILGQTLLDILFRLAKSLIKCFSRNLSFQFFDAHHII